MDAPVPPFPTPSVPVISVVRLTSAVATAPAVAFKKPERLAREKLDVKRLVEEAVVEKRDVVVAFVVVEFVTTKLGNVLLVVVVAVKYAPTISPTTESFAYGEVVPIPMLPVESVVPVPSSPVPKRRLPMFKPRVIVVEVAPML